MNNKMVIENLEGQMVEILKKMNAMSSVKGLVNCHYNNVTYNDKMYNDADESEVDFAGYKSLANVLHDILDTYARLYISYDNKRDMRVVINTTKEKLNTELVLLNEISKIALKDTDNYKQYKCIMFCYNNIVIILEKLERDIKDFKCIDCKEYCFYDLSTKKQICKCHKYKIDLNIDKDDNIIKLDKCIR